MGTMKKKENQRQKFEGLMKLSLLSLLLFAAACTKELPYQYVVKQKNQSKSFLPENVEYIGVSSSDLTNRGSPEAAGALPYWQGTEKRVTFKFTEKDLQVLEIAPPTASASSEINRRLVLSIPIEHVDYRCQTDTRGECLNKEEANNDIPWQQRTQFIPDFDGVKVVEASLLPIEMDKVFGQSCYEESSSRFVGYEITEEALNFQVEKVFKGNLLCLAVKGASIQSLSDLTTTIIYHHSFVRADRLASKDYQPVTYPSVDDGTFGFFTSQLSIPDVDQNQTAGGQITYMNRWNPDRKVIKYSLSKAFSNPKYQPLIAATKVAFERLNAGLASAGVDLRLILGEPSDQAPGDIRNSMIVLVEDPIAAGPLGYGPSVADPRTGEIVSGRVVMYLGNLIQQTKYTYDEVLRAHQADLRAAAKASSKAATQTSSTASTKTSSDQASAESDTAFIKSTAFLQSLSPIELGLSSILKVEDFPGFAGGINLGSQPRSHFEAEPTRFNMDIGKSFDSFLKTQVSDLSSDGVDALAAMSKFCNYPAELFNFNQVVEKGLKNQLDSMKSWEQLSSGEKQAVIDLIIPEIWLPVMIHEMGHNLGLRHNFAGSRDKVNFYSNEELQKLGVTNLVPYSSVMDYSKTDLNALPTLGKYDIAALKFGYRREVETTSGEIIHLDSDLQTFFDKTAKGKQPELRDYAFCTDEHVENNLTCKRFDEGTTRVEIVQSLIDSYHDFYQRRNLRNQMASFSIRNDVRYAGRIRSTFRAIRAAKEEYESLKARTGLSDDAKEWTEIAFAKDIKDAALLSGRFFMDVLKTPDLTCLMAVADESGQPVEPLQLVDIVRLEEFNSDGKTSCQGLHLQDRTKHFVSVAQTGKPFNNLKDSQTNNAYGPYADEIDVRGIWIDKILAAQALFDRKVGNSLFDKGLEAYADIEDLRPEIITLLEQLATNRVVQDLTFTFDDGEEITIPEMPIDLFGLPDPSPGATPSHMIRGLTGPGIASALGLDSVNNKSLVPIILAEARKEFLADPQHLEMDQSLADSLGVYKMDTLFIVDKKLKATTLDDGSIRFVAFPRNKLAVQLIKSIKERVELRTFLSSLEKETLQLILEAKLKVEDESTVKAPRHSTAAVKRAYETPAQVLSQFLRGRLPGPEPLLGQLRALPRINAENGGNNLANLNSPDDDN